MRTRAEIVERAKQHVGHRETAENDSPLIREWLARCGIHKPSAWCAAFASWCLEDAALAGALKLGHAYHETAFPQPGDLMWFPTDDDGHGHIGIVIDVSGREALCIEGNSENSVRYTRRLIEQVRFSRTRDVDAESMPPVSPSAWVRAPLVRVSKVGTR